MPTGPTTFLPGGGLINLAVEAEFCGFGPGGTAELEDIGGAIVAAAERAASTAAFPPGDEVLAIAAAVANAASIVFSLGGEGIGSGRFLL